MISTSPFVQLGRSVEAVLRVNRLSAAASLPVRGSAHAAGFDLAAAEATVVPAGGKAIVKTGLAVATPEGTYARVAPRSGLAAKKMINTGAGVVDYDYRGEVGVVLFNHGPEDFPVAVGDRVAQLILEKVSMAECREVESLDETARGAGGFGSTGVSEAAVAPSGSSATDAAMPASPAQEELMLVKRLRPSAQLPVRGSAHAAGFDLSADEPVVVPAGGKAVVKTGLSIAIPQGTYARIAPRSGLAAKRMIQVGAGVVDYDYRGEVGVVLFNHGSEDFEVSAGDRIAQLILEKVDMAPCLEVESLDETDRGAGGFGSTGVAEQVESSMAPNKRTRVESPGSLQVPAMAEQVAPGAVKADEVAACRKEIEVLRAELQALREAMLASAAQNNGA